MKLLAFPLLCAGMGLSPASAGETDHRTGLRPPVVKAQNCSQRVGPFASQQRAWNMWNQAQSQGYAVSNGVAPCWDGGVRGYCFFVFYSC